MLRYGHGPAPQEGDLYVDQDKGIAYLRESGSWEELHYSEISAEAREQCAILNIVLDVEHMAPCNKRPGVFASLAKMYTGIVDPAPKDKDAIAKQDVDVDE